MKAKIRASQTAMTLVEVLVVIAVICVFVALLLPSLSRSEQKVQRIACINNLKQIGLSFRIWSGDNGDLYPMRVSVTNGGTMEWVTSGVVWPHFQVMSNELNTPLVIVCPQDKARVKALAAIFAALPDHGGYPMSFPSNCPVSYFVGVDAEESKPAMLLAGDGNLEIGSKAVPGGLLNLWTNSAVGWTPNRHSRCGNVAMADGSTRQLVTSRQLREALANTGVATNRLAIP